MKVPGQESANAHTGPPWTSRISGNGPSPCGSVKNAWISRPSGAVHESTVREATLDRTTSVPSLLVETIVLGSWPETTTSSGGRAAELSAMTMSSPTGAAARKNRPPASLVAHRSFAIPASTSTSRTTVSNPRTPVAMRTPSARQERNATSTPNVSGRRTVPSAGSIRTRSPATTRRSLQTASTTATTSLVGELDTHPSCTSDSKSVRSVPADVSIITTRARYQALSPGSSDAIATTQSSSHQSASQMLRSARHPGRSSSEAISMIISRRRVRSTPSKESTSGIHGGRSSDWPITPEPTASDCSASRPATTTMTAVPFGDQAWSSATPSTTGSALASPIASTSRA